MEAWKRMGDRRVGPSVAVVCLLILLGVWSVLSHVVLWTNAAGGVLSGSDGFPAGDQLQYFAWIRDAGRHGLSSNLFDLASDPHVFLHPLFLLSGLLWRAGLGLAASYLVWKPVAVLALSLGVFTYVRRFISAHPATQACVAFLAIFFYNPLTIVVRRVDVGPDRFQQGLAFVSGEMFPAGLLWGYVPAAIAVGLIPLFLLGVHRLAASERELGGSERARVAAWTAGAGLLVSWLHPWQGATLLVILGLSWVTLRPRALWKVLVLPSAAVAAPVAYYAALSQFVEPWMVARVQTAEPRWPIIVLIAGLAPLGVLALAGLRPGSSDFGERMLLLWVPATLIVYFTVSSFPFHAFQGLSVPLAVLAARGWKRLRLPTVLGLATVALLTVPGLIFVLYTVRDAVRAAQQPWVLTRSEAAALRYVERSPRPGGILTTVYLGQAAPALTGRGTWVGHPTHTPDFPARAQTAEALLSARLRPARARSLVRAVDPAFIVSDCRHRESLEPVLGALVKDIRRLGCATVYEIGTSTPTS